MYQKTSNFLSIFLGHQVHQNTFEERKIQVWVLWLIEYFVNLCSYMLEPRNNRKLIWPANNNETAVRQLIGLNCTRKLLQIQILKTKHYLYKFDKS